MKQNLSQRWIEFNFSKLVLKDDVNPNFTRIILMISTQKNVKRLKCPRILKNKVVNFFGQTISFPITTNQFTIIISKAQQDSYETQIGRININRQEIKLLTKKDHRFTVENQMFFLHWSAKIGNLKDNDTLSNATQRDLSEFDIPIINFLRTSRNNDRNEAYSPSRYNKSTEFLDMEQTYSDSSPKKKHYSNRTAQSLLKNSLSISKIQKAKTTSRKSDNKKKSEQKTKKYRQVAQKPKKTSTSEKNLRNKYRLKQIICAGILGAFAGLALQNFY